MSQEATEKKHTTIFVNEKSFDVTEDALTREQILQLAGFDVNEYDLFMLQGGASFKIAPSQAVDLSFATIVKFNCAPK